MIDATDSFKNLKKQQQKLLDYTVLIDYSVPALKKAIHGYDKKAKNYEKFVTPQYFKEKVDFARLKNSSQYYRENLVKYTLLSSFSFFESYFQDVMLELIEFHGGKEKFLERLHIKYSSILNHQDEDIVKSKNKLIEPEKKVNFKSMKNFQSN